MDVQVQILSTAPIIINPTTLEGRFLVASDIIIPVSGQRSNSFTESNKGRRYRQPSICHEYFLK